MKGSSQAVWPGSTRKRYRSSPSSKRDRALARPMITCSTPPRPPLTRRASMQILSGEDGLDTALDSLGRPVGQERVHAARNRLVVPSPENSPDAGNVDGEAADRTDAADESGLGDCLEFRLCPGRWEGIDDRLPRTQDVVDHQARGGDRLH